MIKKVTRRIGPRRPDPPPRAAFDFVQADGSIMEWHLVTARTGPEAYMVACGQARYTWPAASVGTLTMLSCIRCRNTKAYRQAVVLDQMTQEAG